MEAHLERPGGIGNRGLVVTTILVAALASLFGFLGKAGPHPSLKLGASIFLAGAGSALVVGVRALVPTVANRLQDRPATVGTVIRSSLAQLSMAAALIHFAVIAQHFEEYWLYGVFFIGAGLYQIVWAFLLLGPPKRWIDVAAALGNAGLVAAWVVTRTVGTLVGPDARRVERIGFGDVVSTAFEVLIVFGVAALMLGRRRPVRLLRADAAISVFAIAVTLLTLLALYSTVGGSPFVPPAG